MAVELSYCVISNDQRQLLRYCLDAIARERATVPFETEVLVLDNASSDGSADAARAHPATTEVIERPAPRARGANDTAVLAQARGRFCLLLDEECELEPGATAALHAALAARPRAGAACATKVLPDGTPADAVPAVPLPAPAARLWRRLAGADGSEVRRIRSCRSSAMLVRSEAALAVGAFGADLDDGAAEADFCRRLRRAGWDVLLVPEARAVGHG